MWPLDDFGSVEALLEARIEDVAYSAQVQRPALVGCVDRSDGIAANMAHFALLARANSQAKMAVNAAIILGSSRRRQSRQG